MKKEQNAPILHFICQKNTFFPNFFGAIPGSKAESELILDPNTNYVIMVDIVLRAKSC